MKPDRLVRRVFFALFVLFILFIVYASWTPGSHNIGGWWRQISSFEQLSDIYQAHDFRDITTNVLLYIPLGIFLSLALSYRKLRFISPWLFIGPLVSITMETGQAFIGRSPDVVDIVTNTIGFFVGYWLVVAGVRFYGLNPSVLLGFDPDEELDARTQSIAASRFIYICLYVLIALVPFKVSVSVTKIYAQLFPDYLGNIRIVLNPTYHLFHWQETGLKLTWELLGLLPIGALTAILNGARGRLSILTSVYTCVLVVVICESAQVFILSRTTDMVMIPLAAIAGFLGWILVKIWFKLQNIESVSDHEGKETNWRSLAVALAGYGLVVTFFAWSPFDFEINPRIVFGKIIYESNLIPFKEHFATRSLSSALDIVKEAGIFLPFGILISFLICEIMPDSARWKVVLLTGVFCAAFATFTELSQSVCIGRYIDLTDILLAGFGGACGAVLMRLFRFGKFGAAPKV